VKSLAFVFGLCILAVGAVGLLAPSGLVWIAQHSLTPAALYSIAVIRVAFGLLLIAVASTSRAPKTIRVVAFIPLLAGIAMPFVGAESAQASIQWWMRQGSGIVRLTAVPLLALGSFVAYACAPSRRRAQACGDRNPAIRDAPTE